MGHQESSPPRQRHRVPHQRHRHRRRRRRSSAVQTTSPKGPLSLGRLNRESHAPNSHVAVESWLGQVTAPVPTTRLVSPDSRNRSAQSKKRPRSRDRGSSPCRQHARRVDPLWRPQHIPPARGSLSPRLPPRTTYKSNLKRYKRSSGDSSLISDPNARRELRERVHIENTSGREGSSCHHPLGQAEVAIVGTSSPASHTGILPAFEKRPRHKTRADKYDIHKSDSRRRRGRGKSSDRDENRPRASKLKSRKHRAIGKNVMNNFSSEAVLNNRITVQTNLKPGLFNNKRMPRKRPISDLSFSEMPLPAHHECDVRQQKGLSSSRRNELRRESRELEQVSSFFLPPCTGTKQHNAKPTGSGGNENVRDKKLIQRADAIFRTYRDSSVASSSLPDRPRSYCQQSFIFEENPRSVPTVTLGNAHCPPGSSGTTTYFTWSSTQHSAIARESPDSVQPRSMEGRRLATPESVRRALAATGIYKDTGLGPQDTANDQYKSALETHSESSSPHNSVVNHNNNYGRQVLATDLNLKMDSRCSNDNELPVAQLAHLEERWNIILPPEWKPRRPQKAEVPLGDEPQERLVVDIPTSTRPLSRQGLLQDAHAGLAQYVWHHGDHDSGTKPRLIVKIPVSTCPNPDPTLDHTVHADQCRDTITSRDAMPPPPFPCASNTAPRHNLNTSLGLKTATSSDTHVQVSSCEHARISTLDSASWIPQAATSSIVNYERGKILSRLSMRSPIYESQGKRDDSQDALYYSLPHGTHMVTESMGETIADFIARIESEVEEPGHFNEYHQSESTAENQGLPLSLVIDAPNHQNQHLGVPELSPIQCHQFLIDIMDLELEGTHETGRDPSQHEALATPIGDTSMMPVEDPKESTDEFLDMASFWRPNRFSQF